MVPAAHPYHPLNWTCEIDKDVKVEPPQICCPLCGNQLVVRALQEQRGQRIVGRVAWYIEERERAWLDSRVMVLG